MISPLYGQLSPLRIPTKAARVLSSDADANTYLLAVEAADGQELEAGVITAVETFVLGCKSDGIWSAIKASCILAGARTLSGALKPLVGSAPTNLNFVTSDYNRKTGLIGNGSTKYLNSNRNANADPQDSYHQSVYVQAAPSISAQRSFIGYSAPPQSFLDCSTTSQLASRLRTDAGRSIASQGTTLGFKAHSRASATEYTIRSGGLSSLQTTTSKATPSTATHIFARSGAIHSDARLSFYSLGESLDLAALDTRVSTLMTDLAAAIP